MLETIQSPDALRDMTPKELRSLADEVRQAILETVSKTGGHLASNLGMVEATVVMHHLFRSPEDKILFDVGHQCYAHKILTGRYEKMETLRSFGGISGFPNREESAHDVLNEGHCGTSISSALGIAEANKLNGSDRWTVAVVGDGALTNGMIYEALNNCADKELRLILVINDNEMSISRNVGGLHRYLSKIRTSKGYFRLKRRMEKALLLIPLIGKGLASFFKLIKDTVKRIFVANNLFEDLGLIYLGPTDGNDIDKLLTVFEEAKTKPRVCIVHMVTKKGKGYAPAEEKPDVYHSVAPFDLQIGVPETKKDDFSAHFGAHLCEKAEKDARICAITAAMCDGTGLAAFAKTYPDRFFDVGIAEEHAITFAGGLSAGGMVPVVALYSTFAQRAFDQVFHDVSLQKLPMVLALDRAGLVSGDGATHQGIFDIPLFSSLPGVTIESPETYAELDASLDRALAGAGLSIVRYPRGAEVVDAEPLPMRLDEEACFAYSDNVQSADAVIFTYGRVSAKAREAIALLQKECSVGLIKLIRVYPFDADKLSALTENAKLLYFLEEGIGSGGIAEKLAAHLRGSEAQRVLIHAIPGFGEHGSLAELNQKFGFTGEEIARRIHSAFF